MGSNTKRWWHCGVCLHDWQATPGAVVRGTNCPACKHGTESKLLLYLRSLDLNVHAQFKPRWPGVESRSYDYSLPDLNVLIELDGPQHFHQIANWLSPDETRRVDVMKMDAAVEHGRTLIRIPQEDVYYNRNRWKVRLQKAIRMAVAMQEPCIIFMDNSKNEYAKHEEDWYAVGGRQWIRPPKPNGSFSTNRQHSNADVDMEHE